ncbi:HesB/YadR/YfhF family protein [Bacillus shivajii]|uniref:HesB/YadR/YfhF family protein n=1 Tax=Bacillus shivajii TaxID=1983719 RepID=UPI001CF9F0DE|nr:HesB/YadR/YfhF family protein [Bacillus shivajii]UCZ51990.1 HesB/YadR/YfhF family protein [Bacillus shivajii]
MKITVSDKAAEWFKEELQLSSGDDVQFFVRYGGCGNFQTGFSLGVTEKAPEEPAASFEKYGVNYYVEKKDEWYFDGKDFSVNYNEDTEEIEYKHDDNTK